MLEGYDIDDCYFMDMKYSLQSLVDVKYSEVRLEKLVEETFVSFAKSDLPKILITKVLKMNIQTDTIQNLLQLSPLKRKVI